MFLNTVFHKGKNPTFSPRIFGSNHTSRGISLPLKHFGFSLLLDVLRILECLAMLESTVPLEATGGRMASLCNSSLFTQRCAGKVPINYCTLLLSDKLFLKNGTSRNDSTAAGKQQFQHYFQKCQLDLQETQHEPGELIIISLRDL